MSTQTTNLRLTVPELTDPVGSSILAMAENFTTLDALGLRCCLLRHEILQEATQRHTLSLEGLDFTNLCDVRLLILPGPGTTDVASVLVNDGKVIFTPGFDSYAHSTSTTSNLAYCAVGDNAGPTYIDLGAPRPHLLISSRWSTTSSDGINGTLRCGLTIAKTVRWAEAENILLTCSNSPIPAGTEFIWTGFRYA